MRVIARGGVFHAKLSAMSRRRHPNTDSTVNKPLAVFATILVVAGIVGVAYVSSLKKSDQTLNSLTSSSTTKLSSTDSTVLQPQLILVNESAVTLMAADGAVERMSVEEFTLRTKGHRLPYEGSSVANGAVVLFQASSSLSGATKPLVSPDGSSSAFRAPAQADDTSVVMIARKGGEPQKIVLRDKKTPLKDVEIVGWFSNTELAVIATTAGSRSVYVVTTTAEPRVVVTLPETVMLLTIRSGLLWYTTAVQGEGIESPPKGPSEIHRVDVSGKNTLMTRDELRVISSVVAGPSYSERIAYTTDDGQAFVFTEADGKRVVLGKKRPLLFLASGDLILRDGYDLVRMTLDTGVIKKLGALPEGKVDVFDASSILDATP